MKRILMKLVFVMMTITISAQTTYFGFFTRNCKDGVKGEGVMYQKSRNGNIRVDLEYLTEYPPSIVKFSGYYVGDIIDPVDNYVNVRKGPGKNYPIVRKVHTAEWCFDHREEYFDNPKDSGRFFYKKTNGKWWKLYEPAWDGTQPKFIGFIYYDRLKICVYPERS